MSELDDLTKEELLELGEERGVDVKQAMSKAEIRAAIEGEAPAQQVTTTRTKDFLGVPLVNPTPGTSNATDRLGRNVSTGTADYLGRALVP